MSLPRTISIKAAGGGTVEIELAANDPIFVLGANGTGKSALLVKMMQSLSGEGLRIIASRLLIVAEDSSQVTTSQAHDVRNNSRNVDADLAYRAKPPNFRQRAQLYLHTLMELENAFSRELAEAIRGAVPVDLAVLQARQSPLERINSALSAAGFPVAITITSDAHVHACKEGSAPYGVSEMSDGERAALFMLIEAMSAPAASTILIDEPERHIHRSLLLALVTELVEMRDDCCFVISTHDPELPAAFPKSQVALVRGMTVFGECWDLDVVEGADVPMPIREAILGSRRRVLFVEGDEDGLDHGLYNIMFGNISVVARSGSRSVEQATMGARAMERLSWLSAWGIIDRDGRPDEAIAALRVQGIWCLPVYSVESIFYHPVVVETMAAKAAALYDLDSSARGKALEAAINAVTKHLERLAGRAVEKTVRHRVLSSIPGWKQFSQARTVELSVSPKDLFDEELAKLSKAVTEGDWAHIVGRCPIRETEAPGKIASALGYKNSRQYESSVRKTLSEDSEFRDRVLGLLGEAPEGLLGDG